MFPINQIIRNKVEFEFISAYNNYKIGSFDRIILNFDYELENDSKNRNLIDQTKKEFPESSNLEKQFEALNKDEKEMYLSSGKIFFTGGIQESDMNTMVGSYSLDDIIKKINNMEKILNVIIAKLL